MATHTFSPWPKTARLFRDVVISEKLDGTNAAVFVNEDGTEVGAQSRKRVITPDADNFGFASWVYENAGQLADLLGPGLHFGEFWGRGIQRGYGLDSRRFSLFNTERFAEIGEDVGSVQVDTVPVLYRGPFRESEVRRTLDMLRLTGSRAAPGFMNPEGVCVYHTQNRTVFKVTFEHEEEGKAA